MVQSPFFHEKSEVEEGISTHKFIHGARELVLGPHPQMMGCEPIPAGVIQKHSDAVFRIG